MLSEAQVLWLNIRNRRHCKGEGTEQRLEEGEARGYPSEKGNRVRLQAVVWCCLVPALYKLENRALFRDPYYRICTVAFLHTRTFDQAHHHYLCNILDHLIDQYLYSDLLAIFSNIRTTYQ